MLIERGRLAPDPQIIHPPLGKKVRQIVDQTDLNDKEAADADKCLPLWLGVLCFPKHASKFIESVVALFVEEVFKGIIHHIGTESPCKVQ